MSKEPTSKQVREKLVEIIQEYQQEHSLGAPYATTPERFIRHRYYDFKRYVKGIL